MMIYYAKNHQLLFFQNKKALDKTVQYSLIKRPIITLMALLYQRFPQNLNRVQRMLLGTIFYLMATRCTRCRDNRIVN
jgi:hypothetical protein